MFAKTAARALPGRPGSSSSFQRGARTAPSRDLPGHAGIGGRRCMRADEGQARRRLPFGEPHVLDPPGALELVSNVGRVAQDPGHGCVPSSGIIARACTGLGVRHPSLDMDRVERSRRTVRALRQWSRRGLSGNPPQPHRGTAPGAIRCRHLERLRVDRAMKRTAQAVTNANVRRRSAISAIRTPSLPAGRSLERRGIGTGVGQAASVRSPRR